MRARAFKLQKHHKTAVPMAIFQVIRSYDLQHCMRNSKGCHLLMIFPSSEQLPSRTGSSQILQTSFIEKIWLGFRRLGLDYSAQVMWATFMELFILKKITFCVSLKKDSQTGFEQVEYKQWHNCIFGMSCAFKVYSKTLATFL